MIVNLLATLLIVTVNGAAPNKQISSKTKVTISNKVENILLKKVKELCPFDIEDMDEGYTFNLTEDQKTVFSGENGTWAIEENKIVIKFPAQEFKYSIELKGDKLLIDGGFPDPKYKKHWMVNVPD